jgi:hypothetical protein
MSCAANPGRYHWSSSLDVDQLVTDAARDRLAEFGED